MDDKQNILARCLIGLLACGGHGVVGCALQPDSGDKAFDGKPASSMGSEGGGEGGDASGGGTSGSGSDGGGASGAPGASSSSGGPGASCGDGVRQAGEECDGLDMGGDTCLTYSYFSGVLVCNDDCTVNVDNCALVSKCGDGLLSIEEDCEPDMALSDTCASLELGAGELSCDPVTCTIDPSGCDCLGKGEPCAPDFVNYIDDDCCPSGWKGNFSGVCTAAMKCA